MFICKIYDNNDNNDKKKNNHNDDENNNKKKKKNGDNTSTASNNNIDKICSEIGETVSHTVRERSNIAHLEYNRRHHDHVARFVHWKLRGTADLEWVEKWYEQEPNWAIENKGYEMLWNMNMQCDQVTETRRLHIVFIDKEVKTTDVAVPEDVRVNRGA